MSGRNDSLFEWDSSGKVGHREAMGDFGRDRKAGNAKCRRSVEFVKSGGDGWDVREKLECFRLGVVEGPCDLDKGPVLNPFQLFDKFLFWFVWVEPELGSVGDSGNDNCFVKNVRTDVYCSGRHAAFQEKRVHECPRGLGQCEAQQREQ